MKIHQRMNVHDINTYFTMFFKLYDDYLKFLFRCIIHKITTIKINDSEMKVKHDK